MLGIVILNYYAWNQTLECIESIQKAECEESYKVIVVDNASPTPMPDALRDMISKNSISYLETEENIGFARGNNLGIEYAQQMGCDYILLANSDIRFHKKSIDEMIQYLRNHSDVGIVGPKILTPEGDIQKTNLMRKTTMSDKWRIRTIARKLFRKTTSQYYGYDLDYNQTRKVYAVNGCCFMLSPKFLEKIGKLDEHTVLYEEELILGVLMEQQGLVTIYDAEAVVTHHHKQSSKHVVPFSFLCLSCSEIYYCSRYLHASKVNVYLLYYYRSIIYLLHGIRHREFMGDEWTRYKAETGKYLRKYVKNIS